METARARYGGWRVRGEGVRGDGESEIWGMADEGEGVREDGWWRRRERDMGDGG